eukprot:gene2295-2514_t
MEKSCAPFRLLGMAEKGEIGAQGQSLNAKNAEAERWKEDDNSLLHLRARHMRNVWKTNPEVAYW